MKKRNVYFIISLITYLSLAVFLIMRLSSISNLLKALLILGAVALAFLNVTPSFKKNSEISDEKINAISEADYQNDYLVLTNKCENYQFFIHNSTFVFKRINKDDDLITDFDSFRLSDLKKNDKSIPFSSIRDVTFNDSTEFLESGELVFRYEKRATFYIMDRVEQDTIDSYFENVKYRKKSYREKNDNAQSNYSQKKRSRLADLSYLAKLMIPFSVIMDLFHTVTDKPVFYYIFSVIGLAGFIISAYLGVNHLLIIFPNNKSERDDIDRIGDGVIINILFVFPLLWEIFDLKFENEFYSYALLAVPTIIITVICFFKNMPKTEIEKIFRVLSVAAACSMVILFANSVNYTDVRTEQGIVVEIYDGRNENNDTYEIMKSNGEIFTIEYGSFDKNDNVKIEYKKGLLGMKIIDVSTE